jgi:putative membrane protein
MLKSFFLSWGTNFVGLTITALSFSGIQYQDKLRVLVIASLVFGLVNALIRPVAIILSLPAIILTLGLFTLVINTAMLYITSAIYKPFQVTNVWAAVGAVVVVWLVNYVMISLVKEPKS